jgi:ferredoxin-NADP reductase
VNQGEKVLTLKLQGRITKMEPVGARYAVLGISPDHGDPPPQRAGQYTKITFSPEKDPLSNIYSIASAPRADGSFDLCVQLNDDRLKSWLDGVQPGKTWVEYTEPAGNFFIPPEDRTAVLIAGGSGITPLKAILEERAGRNAPTILLYGCADDEAIPFFDELSALKSAATQIWIFAEKIVTARASHGRPQQKLGVFIDPLSHYLMCGPPAFMEAIREELSAAGIDADHIHQDRY